MEEKITAPEYNAGEDIIFLLKIRTLNNVKLHKERAFYSTKIQNKNSPVISGQTKLLTLFCDGYQKMYNTEFHHSLVVKLSDFLIEQRGEDNLYRYNMQNWKPQDEGIASVWAAISLAKAYEVTDDEKYLETSVSTCNAMIRDLYSERTGLIHTRGQDFWCLNATSKFAYLNHILTKINPNEEFNHIMNSSLSLIINNIAPDGHFPYTERRYGVYILLYHASVMFFLELCLESAFLEEKVRIGINEVLTSGKSYLLSRLDEKNRFIEPEMKGHLQYIITAVTSLAALQNKIPEELNSDIMNNALRHFSNGRLYLFLNNKDELFNDRLYKMIDIYMVETLYWIVQYRLRKEN